MQIARGSLGASFIPMIRPRRWSKEWYWARTRAGDSLPKAHAGNRPTSTLDVNEEKKQETELKGLECLNLNTLVYAHWGDVGDCGGEVGGIWPKMCINKATLEEGGHLDFSSQHETLGFGLRSLGEGEVSKKPTKHPPMGNYQKSDFPSFWQI